MTPVNGTRVLLGGLVAGLIILAGEVAGGLVIGADFQQWLASLGVQPPGPAIMIAVALCSLALGTITVWLYAALLPRYGGGERTACRAACVVWTLVCLLPHVSLVAMGILPAGRLFALMTVWPLVEILLAAVAGSRVYREERSAQATGGMAVAHG